MPGMTATISIKAQDKKGVLLVPNEALRFSPSFNMEKFNDTGVWILDKGAMQPRRVSVKMGIIGDNKTEVSGELTENDRAVLWEAVERNISSGFSMPRPPRRR